MNLKKERKKRRNRIWLAMLTVLVALLAVFPAFAADQELPYASNNLRNYLIKYSSIAATSNGYVRVFCMKDGSIYAENYDDSFVLTGRVKLPLELQVYGGFYSGSDAYYLVFGQNNTAEDTGAEVVRVVKYDKNWNRIGAASLKGDSSFGHEIRYPFDYGNVSMEELNGVLYIVTGHEGYVDPAYNQGHQGFLMFAVDEASMTGGIVDADLWHSFSQHIAIKDSENIYVLEESEGSRQTQLTKKTSSDLNGTTIPVLKYGGSRTSAWAIPTCASADAVACSSDHVLAVGTSIDQSRYEDSSYTKTYNIYLTVTPMDGFSEENTKVTWITQDNLPSRYQSVKLTKVNDDRFLLSWESTAQEEDLGAAEDTDSMSNHVIHYLFLNGQGEIVSSEYKKAAALSECEPVVKNGKVVFYSSDGASTGFYTIDPNNGNLTKKVYASAGPNATWSFSGGTLTISGTGEISPDLSKTGFDRIKDRILRIVIADGITAIGESAFADLDNLAEVKLGKELTEIGNSAFAYCESLKGIRLPKGVRKIGDKAFAYIHDFRTIYIPKSVTDYGEDIFKTGYTWVGSNEPVINAVIYCEDGSAAQSYAKKGGAGCVTATVTIKDKTAKESGKAISVDKAEVSGTDGKISYLYYTDKSCKVKTAKAANGAAEAGSAPSKAGTYYVKAVIPADDVFEEIASNTAKLVITASGTGKASDKAASSKTQLKKNQVIKDTKTKATYKITKVTKKNGKVNGGTVTYTAPSSKKIKSVTIGATVKLSGVSFKITAIGSNAFKGCTAMTKAVIGTNIAKIGAGAFDGCKKLKSITIKTSKLKSASVGKNAFRGTSAKAVVKVPKQSKAAYKKWLVKKGINKKAKIK